MAGQDEDLHLILAITPTAHPVVSFRTRRLPRRVRNLLFSIPSRNAAHSRRFTSDLGNHSNRPPKSVIPTEAARRLFLKPHSVRLSGREVKESLFDLCANPDAPTLFFGVYFLQKLFANNSKFPIN
jgi:hypothetical protein